MSSATKYRYGAPPITVVDDFRPEWVEYMHYLYLPVVMKGEPGLRLPERLEFIRPAVERVAHFEGLDLDANGRRGGPEEYVYVSARRGFAFPGNPLNRPGWHSDGFGSDDRNYVWSDRWPTRIAEGPIHEAFDGISEDHRISAMQFDAVCEHPEMYGVSIYSCPPFAVVRLDPAVIHSTPLIDPPGGDRSFFKISVSPARYNLLGNSHNHLFDYDWRMHPRGEVRNDPIRGGGDAGPQDEEA